MKTTIKDNVLHIEIPLHAPRPSSTGKTLTVASSNGNQITEVKINGSPVIVGLNALHQTRLTGTDVRQALPPVPLGIGGRANSGDSSNALFYLRTLRSLSLTRYSDLFGGMYRLKILCRAN